MPSQTAGGLPYPLPSEPVRDGAVAIKNLADAIEGRGGGVFTQVGKTQVTTQPAGIAIIFFPVVFSGVPVSIQVTGENGYRITLETVSYGYFGGSFHVMVHKPDGSLGASVTTQIYWSATGPK
jgi:hypothetical protein